jgi:hypothetical protein
MKINRFSKLILSFLCVSVLLTSFLIPCYVELTCPNGQIAWCSTYGSCPFELCFKGVYEVECICNDLNGNQKTFHCPDIFNPEMKSTNLGGC